MHYYLREKLKNRYSIIEELLMAGNHVSRDYKLSIPVIHRQGYY